METLKQRLEGFIENKETFLIIDSYEKDYLNADYRLDSMAFEYIYYNQHKNNRIEQGDIFIYRQSGKSTTDRKFYFYGGGTIGMIEEPDENGRTRAMVLNPFEFDDPIEQGLKQGLSQLEDYQWKTKQRKKGSWGHFWNLDGINVFDIQDLLGLFADKKVKDPVLPSLESAVSEYQTLHNRSETCFTVDNQSIFVSGDIGAFHFDEALEVESKKLPYTYNSSKKTSPSIQMIETILQMVSKDKDIFKFSSSARTPNELIVFDEERKTKIMIKAVKIERMNPFYLDDDIVRAMTSVAKAKDSSLEYKVLLTYEEQYETILQIVDAREFDHLFHKKPVYEIYRK